MPANLLRSCSAVIRGHRTSALINSRAFSSSISRNKERLVILGSGWGGYEVLRRVNKKAYDVSVVSDQTHFTFTPLLASASVASIECGSVIEPVRRYVPPTKYYQAWCDSIDFKRKTIDCTMATPPSEHDPEKTTFQLPYDKLVIAVGAYSQTFGVPGVKEHACFLKGVGDARVIRRRIIECFEQANSPALTEEQRRACLHFRVVGGGPTGIEFAAELDDMLREDIARHFPTLAGLGDISVYDVAPRILGGYDDSLSQYAMERFAREGIKVKTGHHVEKVEKGKMWVKEEGEVPFGLLVWSTGLAPNPLVQSLNGVLKDAKTKSLLTDEMLRLLHEGEVVNKDVWAIGDAAVTKDGLLPATAQVASQKGIYVSKRLNRIARGKVDESPFQFQNKGLLTYLGRETAIFDRSQADSAFKMKGTGRTAWLIWKSAYLYMTLSWRNRILLSSYWFLNQIFGRDLSRY